MKLVSLLNKIYDELPVPKKIKAFGNVYEYDPVNRMYYASECSVCSLMDNITGYDLNAEITSMIDDTYLIDDKIDKLLKQCEKMNKLLEELKK